MRPPAGRDDRRTLLKGVAIGVGASGTAFFAAGAYTDHPHRVIWALILPVVAVAAGWAGERLGNRQAAQPASRVTN